MHHTPGHGLPARRVVRLYLYRQRHVQCETVSGIGVGGGLRVILELHGFIPIAEARPTEWTGANTCVFVMGDRLRRACRGSLTDGVMGDGQDARCGHVVLGALQSKAAGVGAKMGHMGHRLT